MEEGGSTKAKSGVYCCGVSATLNRPNDNRSLMLRLLLLLGLSFQQDMERRYRNQPFRSSKP